VEKDTPARINFNSYLVGSALRYADGVDT